MAKPNYKPTPEDLKSAPEHVLWDIKTLHAAVKARSNPSIWHHNHILGSVLNDSALLHIRSLYHFFTGIGSSSPDIFAGHFIKNDDGIPWTSSSLSYTASCIRDINKFRSHLTYSRRSIKRTWTLNDLCRMKDEIDIAFHEFLGLLPAEERSVWQINDLN
jgi:hypothetical protein